MKYSRIPLCCLHWLILVQCSNSKNTEGKESEPTKTNIPFKTNPAKFIRTPTVSPHSTKSTIKNSSSRKKKTENTYALYQQKIAGFKFEAFLVQEKYNGKAAPLDLVSHEDARLYRKTLTLGLATGSNFAGKYTLVSITCGASCQDNYIIETQTGKIADKVKSSSGVSFRPDSRLLIVNPPNLTTNYQVCQNCEPTIYVFENGLLYKAKLIR